MWAYLIYIDYQHIMKNFETKELDVKDDELIKVARIFKISLVLMVVHLLHFFGWFYFIITQIKDDQIVFVLISCFLLTQFILIIELIFIRRFLIAEIKIPFNSLTSSAQRVQTVNNKIFSKSSFSRFRQIY